MSKLSLAASRPRHPDALLIIMLLAAWRLSQASDNPHLNQPTRVASAESEIAGGFTCGCLPARTGPALLRQDGLRPGLGSPAHGEKSILLYRVDFSDAVGAAISSNAAVELISGLDDFYREMSYGQMGFATVDAGSVATDTLRLPEPSSAYDNNFDKIMTDTRQAAANAGYTVAGFDFDVVCTGTKPWLVYGAMAYVGGPGVWAANNNFKVGVIGHELGHNLGLPHASFWFTGDESTVGPGSIVEYGDPFDCMGVPGGSTSHFNVRFKHQLGWIPDADAPFATTNGLYRLTAQDHPSATTGVRALRIPRNRQQDCWLEFRQFFNNRWVTNGVTLRWGGEPSQNTLLLDTSPGSTSGKQDSAIPIGRTFSDRCADLHITPLGKAGTSPETIDVVVQLGSFPDNHPPVLSLTASATNVALGETVLFQAAGMDPDGDPLAYSWEFGDGALGGNELATAHAWSLLPGAYSVRCIATDMKGGTASETVLVVVGPVSPLFVTGRVLQGGRPVEGVLVKSPGVRGTYTDSSGSYRLAWNTPGRYSLSAIRDGLLCYNAGFENPVSLASNLSDFDFAAVPVSLMSITLVATGSVWKYLDTGVDPGPGWANPAFDDGAWASGPAKLGYGTGTEATVLSYGLETTNRHITAWFRHRFTVDNLPAVDHLVCSLRRDDSAILYLNGAELYRENLPPGPVQPSTTALADISTSEERTFFKRFLPRDGLLSGTNVLAVEIHQSDPASPDLSLDLELTAWTRDPEAFVPRLAASRSDSDVVLSWPAGYADWSVRSTDRLPTTAGWAEVSAPLAVTNGRAHLLLFPTDNTDFYQLYKVGWCGPWW